MANFAIDPRLHAPRGFEVIPHDPEDPPLRLLSYLGSYMDATNEDLAIAMLVSAVAKEDFSLMAAVSYGPPWARCLGGYQDRLLGGPLGLPGLSYTASEGVEHKDYTGVVLG
jgi:hypothetical protein